jgi:hypothetical protein
MYASIILENLIAISQPTVKRVTKTMTHKYNIEGSDNTQNEQLEDTIEETIQAINDKIINPILEDDINTIQKSFEKRVFPFTIHLKTLNMAFLRILGTGQTKDISKILEFENSLYNELEEDIKAKKGITPDISRQILGIIENLRNYDITIVGISITNQTKILKILDIIDVQELRKCISGATLAFLCILSYIDKQDIDQRKLKKLLELAQDNIEVISAFTDLIDLFSEEKVIPANLEGDIGIANNNGFNINMKKKKVGQEYKVSFDNSQYKIKRNEKDKLIIYEIG